MGCKKQCLPRSGPSRCQLTSIDMQPSVVGRVINAPQALPWVAERLKLTFAESQTAAIRQALACKVLVVTGGPGVGKTTIVRGILRVLSAKGVKLLLCAPTG